MRLVPVTLALLAALPCAQKDPLAPRFVDPDADGDGLSDFQETHKYGTDPARADSDGDGTPDGDWDERREYAYTVRTVVRVVPPVDVSAVDDHQDARVLAEGDGWVEIEAIHYPLGTAHEAITPDAKWRDDVKAWKRYLESTVTSRFDAKISRALLKEIEQAGVDVKTADDLTLAVAAARRLMERATFEDSFTTFLTDFQGKRAIVPPDLRDAVRRRETESGRSIEEQWERELFADGMFEHRVHGSCTSSAIYLCGGLRAAGIPARIVLSIPLVDANDPEQLAMVEQGIRHHRVREVALAGLRPLAGSWASHTFNEVMVGGRWRRLNYTRIGQPILDTGLYGLTTHVLTVRDWADARMGLTVGRRQELGLRDDVFRTQNPYRTLAVDDAFGPHVRIENPPFDPEAPLEEVELARAFWASSDERPGRLGLSGVDLETDRVHAFLAASLDGRDHEHADVVAFWDAAGKELRLQPDEGEAVPARAIRGFWSFRDQAAPNLYFLLAIDERDRARMPSGARYAIVPASPEDGPRFVAAQGLALTVP